MRLGAQRGCLDMGPRQLATFIKNLVLSSGYGYYNQMYELPRVLERAFINASHC